jgi:fumarylacetoacetase
VSSEQGRPTWVPGAHGSLHDADNLPYAVDGSRVVTRIGDHVLDLAAAAGAGLAGGAPYADLLDVGTLTRLMAAGPVTWAAVRDWVVALVTDPAHEGRLELRPVAEVTPVLPFEVGDYVDFYASRHHATNVGRIFRPDGEALHPSWEHLPVGYHGRSGSVVVSGTAVHRPSGQRRVPGESTPTFGPTARLDLEAELGFVVGRSLPLGQRVPTAELADTVFGVVGLNDWSARDIQAWEYVPLGPHLGKSFATTIAGWVTPLAALAHARVDLPAREVELLPYLHETGPSGYDVEVEVEVAGTVVARAPYATTAWSPAQMLAHLTVNGASLRVGDLYASGTISGPEKHQRGSLLELSWGGTEPWLAGGEERLWLEDGDEVVLRYTAPGRLNARMGLGEVRGTVLPTT